MAEPDNVVREQLRPLRRSIERTDETFDRRLDAAERRLEQVHEPGGLEERLARLARERA